MGTPNGAPGPELVIDDLGWAELADIVWLASAVQSSRPAPPASEDPAPEDPAPERPVPAETDLPADRPADTAPEDREPVRPPPEPELPPQEAAPAQTPLPARTELAALPDLPSPRGTGGLPADAPLIDTLECFRALRPLKRTTRSWRDDTPVLDERATADQVAQTRLWWPVTRPRTERWLDLTLVVDRSPLTTLWQSQVSAFTEMLTRLGAFRTIQVRLLEVVKNDEGSPAPVLRGGTAQTAPRDPAEILDASGRRVVLLLTDGLGDTWHPGVLLPLLALWGRTMPVSVVHLLPQWLWERGRVRPHRAELDVHGPMRPNSRWSFDLPDAWLEPDPAALTRPGTLPIPVIEMRPRWLRWWSGLVTGENRSPVTGAVLLAHPDAPPAEPERLPSQDHVRRFRSQASPPALRLATLLAAVPAHLDVAQLIRHRFVPEAGNEHIGELLLSGLLHPAGDDPSEEVKAFTFREEVRELLLSGARRSETAGVVRAAAAEFSDTLPVLARLRDAIADPHNTPDPEPATASTADVEIERAVMRALSGPYLSRADRLHKAGTDGRSALLTPESIKASLSRTESDTMPELAERPSDSAAPSPSDAQPHRASDTGFSRSSTDSPDYHTSSSTRTFHKRQKDDPPPVWGNVPPRNPNFTGRRELLEQLGKRLNAGGTTAVLPSALHGMGGIGKTQMATEYVYRHSQDYDLIWWIEAARTTQIRASLTELARQLGLPGSSESSTAVPAVREALRLGKPFRRWLLIFDAAESPEEVLPFIPTNGSGEVLITSRNPDWAGVARPLELAVFDREESIELLGKRGPEIDLDDADRLAEKLGDLPLAVEQAAAWRAMTGMPVAEYLRLFDESMAEILDTSAPPAYEVSVAAAWNVSFDELKTRNPAAHQILHICAFFSPEPISRDLFTGVSRGVSISPELDAALRDPIKLAKAIRDINRYGLAKIDHGNNTIQLHRLVQLVLRNRVMAPQLQAQMKHGAHQLLSGRDPNDPESARHWPRYRELLPHAYAADIVDCEDGWVRQLAINLMRYLFAWGDHDEAVRLAEYAYGKFQRQLGPTDPHTLDVAQRLGFYLWGLGRYEEAARVNQLTLQRRIQVSGEDSEETLSLQTNIVIDLRAKGDFAQASKLSEEIYTKSKRLFGEDDPDTLYAAFQHALSLRLSGEYRAAAKLDENTLQRRTEVLGPDHPRTLSTHAALIVDRREAGEYIRARIEQETLAGQFQARLGEHNADTVAMQFLLSVARRKDGEHTTALALSTAALDWFDVAYGADHPTTMACALAHSIDLRHSGDLSAAHGLGSKTFERYRLSLGEDHPHTIAATVDLAVTLRLQGEAADARVLDERALEHFRTGIGPNHPYAVIAAINLASDLASVGETGKAVELGQDAVERAERVLGTGHPTTLAAAINLGLDLRAVGRTAEAEQYRNPILDRYRKVLGEAHPGTIAAIKGARADCDIDPILM
ncbi:Tetratricopeptide repeat-containing protein [Lentzea fradiae]|uniref:Tetratricopeptide repeat-containing protein n=1 Tax=Lentzea fradiae TaxID=200378 RepID=A0A1G7N3Z4_9PSEU|nr:FxSxx-COOH system tetratricopeptide repeat protein [Lentzea fradiae]SDF68672.1 Tetratricopeptide repeat-containing protein [Lentzea fradiae]